MSSLISPALPALPEASPERVKSNAEVRRGRSALPALAAALSRLYAGEHHSYKSFCLPFLPLESTDPQLNSQARETFASSPVAKCSPPKSPFRNRDLCNRYRIALYHRLPPKALLLLFPFQRQLHLSAKANERELWRRSDVAVVEDLDETSRSSTYVLQV